MSIPVVQPTFLCVFTCVSIKGAEKHTSLKSERSHLSEGRDEAGDAHQTGVGEQLGDLGHAADVLLAVHGGEAQVLVQAVADVVSVQRVAGDVLRHQELLQCKAEGGLASA